MKRAYFTSESGDTYEAVLPDDAPTEDFGLMSRCDVPKCPGVIDAIDFEAMKAHCEFGHGIDVPKRTLKAVNVDDRYQAHVMEGETVVSRHDFKLRGDIPRTSLRTSLRNPRPRHRSRR